MYVVKPSSNPNIAESTMAKLKPTDPEVVPWSKRCGACGHSRAHHIGVDGPCNVLMEERNFCKCDRYSAERPAPVVVPPVEI